MKKYVLPAVAGVLCLLSIGVSNARGLFKVLSYNVYEGFQDNEGLKDAFVDWVLQKDPDMIAFQELNSFTQSDLQTFAHRYNHPYAVILKDKGYYVGLTSKYPISQVERVTDNMKLGYMYARVNDYHVVVLHLNPFSYRRRQEEVNGILSRLSYIAKSEKILVMGDFNSLSERDSAVYNAPGRIDRAKQFLDGGQYDGISNYPDGKFDYSVISRMEKGGFFDTFHLFPRAFEPTTNPYVNKLIKDNILVSPSGGPARIDYIWINQTLKKKLVKFDVLKDSVTSELSDHFPIMVHLKE